VEQSHIAHVVEQLIEAYVLMCDFLAFFLSTDSTCFYIPNCDGKFLSSDFDSRLLEDTLKESSLPPANPFPYLMVTDEFL
jgi:hypothetical protein